MAADDGFAGFNNSCVGGFHAVDPAGLVPLFLACVAPIGDRNILLFSAAEADGRARNPAVDENIMLGILKESLFRQRGFQFGEISVDIGGNIVFHRNYFVISFNIVSSSGMSCMTVS